MSKKKIIVRSFVESKLFTLWSEVFESELLFLKNFKLISVSKYYSGSCCRRKTMSLSFEEIFSIFSLLDSFSSWITNFQSQKKRYIFWWKKYFYGYFHRISMSNFIQFWFCENHNFSGVQGNGSNTQYFFIDCGGEFILFWVFRLKACDCLKFKEQIDLSVDDFGESKRLPVSRTSNISGNLWRNWKSKLLADDIIFRNKIPI